MNPRWLQPWLLALVMAGSPLRLDADPAIPMLETRILADHALLLRARDELAALRASGRIGVAEQRDYAAWIAGLETRIADDCRLLVASLGVPPPGHPCHGIAAPVPAIDLRQERSREESRTALDAELNRSLGEFDDKLLREQARVKTAAPKTTATARSGAATGGGQAADADDGQGQDGATDDKSTGERGTTDTSPGATEQAATGGDTMPETAGPSGIGGKPTATSPASVPVSEPVPDGSDDDIVARQLREAAEKETDPELKKKLWEEYRRYKAEVR